MAIPSARWPHAVFPGLSGNKGRKPPFYSITLAAPGHRANTKESGFIKTISARNEPNRLIYQPCRERERGDWLVGGFQTLKATQASFTWTQLLSTVLLHCWWGLCARIWVGGFEETWQQLQYRPEGKKMQRWQLRVYVCFCAGLCMSASMQMKLVEDGRNINALPARPWGFGEGKKGETNAGGRKEWKEGRDAAWGPPTQQILYTGRRGEKRERRTFELGSK